MHYILRPWQETTLEKMINVLGKRSPTVYSISTAQRGQSFERKGITDTAPAYFHIKIREIESYVASCLLCVFSGAVMQCVGIKQFFGMQEIKFVV